MSTAAENDSRIAALIAAGVLRVDACRGRIYSLRSQRPHRALRGTRNHKGYTRIGITLREPDGSRRKLFFLAHRVVWVSVYGPLPPGWEVDHKERRKRDNRIERLEAVPGEVNNARRFTVPKPTRSRGQ